MIKLNKEGITHFPKEVLMLGILRHFGNLGRRQIQLIRVIPMYHLLRTTSGTRMTMMTFYDYCHNGTHNRYPLKVWEKTPMSFF